MQSEELTERKTMLLGKELRWSCIFSDCMDSRLYELEILDGSFSDGIISGNFTEFKDGKYVTKKGIKNGFIQ